MQVSVSESVQVWDMKKEGPKLAHLAIQKCVQFRRSRVKARWNRALLFVQKLVGTRENGALAYKTRPKKLNRPTTRGTVKFGDFYILQLNLGFVYTVR